jgi:hypothetical protein
VPNRKEEQERRRAERLAAEQQAERATRRRLVTGYVVAGFLSLALVVGVVVALTAGGGGGGASDSACAEAHVDLQTGITNGYEPDCREGTPPPSVQTGDLEAAAKAAGCVLEVDLPEEGATHIGSDPADAPAYHTKPPTSGDHIDPGLQQADGAYAETPAPAYTVHSLEHGRVNVQYSENLPQEDQLALKGLFDESPGGMLLFPNGDMPYEVAAAAWTRLIGCRQFEGNVTLDAIRDFRDVYIDQAPESVPITGS